MTSPFIRLFFLWSCRRLQLCFTLIGDRQELRNSPKKERNVAVAAWVLDEKRETQEILRETCVWTIRTECAYKLFGKRGLGQERQCLRHFVEGSGGEV